MAKNLLNPLAIDHNGQFVNIKQAEKGQHYFCPVCKEPLTFRQQGQGPHAHRNHFSHRVNSDCHGVSESEIHKKSKERIYELLKLAIENKENFRITWTCPECGGIFHGNLLQWAKSVEMEKNLEKAQPDIALLDGKGKVLVAIEVVFKHDVEKPTWEFYNENNIVVVRIIVKSMDDCENIEQKLNNPDDVNLCYTESCPKHNHLQVLRKVVPLYKKDCQERTFENIAALAVAIVNPFEESINYGKTFTEKDEIKASEYARWLWPNRQYKLVQGTKFTYLSPVAPKPVTPHIVRTTYNQNPFQLTPLEQAQKKYRQNKAIKRNYAIRSKSKKRRH